MLKYLAPLVKVISPLLGPLLVKKTVTIIGCAFLIIFIFHGYQTDRVCERFIEFEQYRECYELHNNALIDVLEEINP